MTTKIIFLDIDGVLNNASDSDMHCHMDDGCDSIKGTFKVQIIWEDDCE